MKQYLFLGTSLCLLFYTRFSNRPIGWLLLISCCISCLLVGLSSQEKARCLLKGLRACVWVPHELLAPLLQGWPNLQWSTRQLAEFPVKQLHLQSCQIPRFYQTWPVFKKLLRCLNGSIAQMVGSFCVPGLKQLQLGSRGGRAWCPASALRAPWQLLALLLSKLAREQRGSVPPVGWARTRPAKTGGDGAKAAVVFQIYICIMGCSCFTCFSKTYATK